MNEGIRLQLPRELADELIADEVVVRSFVTRAGPVGEMVSIAIDTIGTGADLVTVAAASLAVPKVLTRIRERLCGSGQADTARVTMRCSGREVEFDISADLNAQDAEDLLTTHLQQVRRPA